MSSLTFKEINLVAFNNAAAGHDGVMSDASGEVIIKPCTAAEIAFYESARASHPAFASYMPTFMGTLTLASRQPSVDAEAIEQPTSPAQEQPHDATRQPSDDGVEDQTTEKPNRTQPALEAGTADKKTSTTQENADDTRGHIFNEAGKDKITEKRSNETQIPFRRPSQGTKLDTDLAIVLENITAGFVRPNILDAKLGSRLWAALASPEKRARMDKVASETTSASLGFRVAGMKVWEGLSLSPTQTTSPTRPTNGQQQAETGSVEDEKRREEFQEDGYRNYGKFYGQRLTVENVSEAFERFLFVDSAGVDHRLGVIVARRFLKEVQGLRKMLELEESRMYSASILFVYEGDGEALRRALQEEEERERQGKVGGVHAIRDDQGVEVDGDVNGEHENEDEDEDEDDEDQEKESSKVHGFKLIDFAHASWTPGLGPDENALKGVRSVERILEELSKVKEDTIEQ